MKVNLEKRQRAIGVLRTLGKHSEADAIEGFYEKGITPETMQSFSLAIGCESEETRSYAVDLGIPRSWGDVFKKEVKNKDFRSVTRTLEQAVFHELCHLIASPSVYLFEGLPVSLLNEWVIQRYQNNFSDYFDLPMLTLTEWRGHPLGILNSEELDDELAESLGYVDYRDLYLAISGVNFKKGIFRPDVSGYSDGYFSTVIGRIKANMRVAMPEHLLKQLGDDMRLGFIPAVRKSDKLSSLTFVGTKVIEGETNGKVWSVKQMLFEVRGYHKGTDKIIAVKVENYLTLDNSFGKLLKAMGADVESILGMVKFEDEHGLEQVDYQLKTDEDGFITIPSYDARLSEFIDSSLNKVFFGRVVEKLNPRRVKFWELEVDTIIPK